MTGRKVNEGGGDMEGQPSRYLGRPSRRWPKGRPLCGGDKGFDKVKQRHDGYCVRTAGEQTDHYGIGSCKWHGGNTKRHHVAVDHVKAERAAEKLRVRLRRFDEFDGTEIDYRAEALRMIAFCKHRASEYGQLLADAYEAAERLREAHEADELLISERVGEPEDENPRFQTARADLERIFLTGGVTAIVGHKWDADRHGRIYAVEEGVRALVKLEREAIADLRSAIALAKDLKVAEAQIDLAKMVGGMILTIITGVLGDLGRRGLVAAKADDALVLELIAHHMDLVGGRQPTVVVA